MNSQLPEDFNPLSLDNQLCFALYVCSKEIIRKYDPLLKPLDLTYTAYITLMALWEKDNVTVKDLGEKLFLDSGTLTPLLKKMEDKKLISRNRSKTDERTVYITLTNEGKEMRSKCAHVPQEMACSCMLNLEKAPILLETLHDMMQSISAERNAKEKDN